MPRGTRFPTPPDLWKRQLVPTCALGEPGTIFRLDPPHSPRDRRPRLEISFGVNAERWLVATVRDLLTQKDLMREGRLI